jgi:hypothetical protein
MTGREDVLDKRDGVRCMSKDCEVRANLDADGALSMGKEGAKRLRDGGTLIVGVTWAAGTSTCMASSFCASSWAFAVTTFGVGTTRHLLVTGVLMTEN